MSRCSHIYRVEGIGLLCDSTGGKCPFYGVNFRPDMCRMYLDGELAAHPKEDSCYWEHKTEDARSESVLCRLFDDVECPFALASPKYPLRQQMCGSFAPRCGRTELDEQGDE